MFKLNKKVLSSSLALTIIMSTAPGMAYATMTTKALEGKLICKEQQQYLSRIDGSRAFDYIRELSDNIGPRIAGTNEEYQAAKYIKKQFDNLGYNTEIQEFKYASGKGTSSLKYEDKVMESSAFTNSKATDGVINGEVVNCGLGSKDDFSKVDVKGKIAIVERGTYTFVEKVENAANSGAVALIMYNNTSGISTGQVGDVSVPAVGIEKTAGLSIVEKLKAGEKVTISLEVGKPETTTSWNVVAKQAARGNDRANTDDIVYVSAHYDSVPKAPGANDNASGVASMIEIANAIKDLDTDKEIRFIACGSEEVGLKGSAAYVKSLTKDELERSIGNFNLDMVATNYEPCSELAVYTNQGKDNIVTDAVKEAGERLKDNTTDFTSYDGNHETYKDGGLVAMGSSDHVSFDNAGIPSALFINGDPEKLDDPRTALEPYYHKPTDHTEHASKERLERTIKLIGSAIYETVDTDHEDLVSTENMMKDLNAMASKDNARVTGFEGEHDAADYIVGQYKDMGLKTRKQIINGIDGFMSEGSTVKVGDKELDSKTFTYSNSTSGVIEGELVDCGLGKADQIGDVKGKVALIKRGEISFAEKIDNATAKGAVGVIIYNNAEGTLNGTLGDYQSKRAASTSISKADGEALAAKLANEKAVKVSMEVKTLVEKNSHSYNVVASLPAAKNPRTAQTIVIGAHMDCVQTPGANDNGSGTVSILEAARVLSRPEIASQLKYNVEFVNFGAEEIGLVGSKEYVKSLQDSGRVNKVKAMINLDMVGVGNNMVMWNSNESTSHEVTDLAKKVASELGCVDMSTTKDLHSTSSDHASFEAVGIPSTFIGYTLDESGKLDQYYHTKGDKIETINPKWLKNSAQVVVNSVLKMQSQSDRSSAKASIAKYDVKKVEKDNLSSK